VKNQRLSEQIEWLPNLTQLSEIQHFNTIQSFLFSGTTTMVAAAQEADRHNDGEETDNPKTKTANTLIGALQLSLLVGAGLGAGVFVFARQLLMAMIGGGPVDPSIMNAAMKYVQIRALGMPAAAMLGSVQTACLGMRDIKSPLYVTGIAALANLVMSVVFLRNPQAWLGGAAGAAALATTFSQYLAAGWVLRWLLTRTKGKSDVQSAKPLQQGGIVSHSTQGFLSGRMKLWDLVRMPRKGIRKGFAPFVLPVITTQAGRCSVTATIDHVVSSSLSTASMAANQIICSVFYGLVPVSESLSLARQNFVPGIVDRGHSKAYNPSEQAFAMRRLLMNFLKSAGLCGLLLAAIMGSLPLYSGAFTSDAAVRGLVTSVVPLLFITCLKHGVFCAAEGLLLGQKDLRFLSTQYGAYTLLIPFIMLQIKKAAMAGSTAANLKAVWLVYWVHDLFRTVLMAGRIFWLQRKREHSSG
jgi:Na+-driven multidrug efflux pump